MQQDREKEQGAAAKGSALVPPCAAALPPGPSTLPPGPAGAPPGPAAAEAEEDLEGEDDPGPAAEPAEAAGPGAGGKRPGSSEHYRAVSLMWASMGPADRAPYEDAAARLKVPPPPLPPFSFSACLPVFAPTAGDRVKNCPPPVLFLSGCGGSPGAPKKFHTHTYALSAFLLAAPLSVCHCLSSLPTSLHTPLPRDTRPHTHTHTHTQCRRSTRGTM